MNSDDLALPLRIGHAGQLVQEAVHRVHIDQVGVHLVPEHLDDLLRLTLAQQAVVHMDTGQLLANGFDEQSGHDRGVHAAGQSQKDLLVTHLLADQLHLVGDKVLHIPVGLCAADLEHKVAQCLFAGRGILRPGLIAFVIGQQHGHRSVVDLLGGVDLHTVYHTVGTPVQDDALHIRQSGKLFGGDVVGMDLAVNAQCTDLTGQTGIFLTAQIKYQNHVLLHCSASYFLYDS